MNIFYGFDSFSKIPNPVVTLGSYDGIHLGHREIVSQMNKIAQQIDGKSVVITLSPHPREVLEGVSPKLLLTLDEKIKILEEVGVDVLIVIPFTREFGAVEPYDFVKEYLVNKIGTKKIVIGYNHHFGRANKGNIELLRSLESEFGFEVIQISKQRVASSKVSSTVIRNLISTGEMTEANRLLGYQYFISVDTALDGSISIASNNKLIPPVGEYDVVVTHNNIELQDTLTIDYDNSIKLSKTLKSGSKERIIIRFI